MSTGSDETVWVVLIPINDIPFASYVCISVPDGYGSALVSNCALVIVNEPVPST